MKAFKRDEQGNVYYTNYRGKKQWVITNDALHALCDLELEELEEAISVWRKGPQPPDGWEYSNGRLSTTGASMHIPYRSISIRLDDPTDDVLEQLPAAARWMLAMRNR